jgi:ankyrin repeat protein
MINGLVTTIQVTWNKYQICRRQSRIQSNGLRIIVVGNNIETSNKRNLILLFDKINDLPGFEDTRLVSVNQKNIFGDTPLHVAVIWGDINAIRILIDFGADINCQGEHGYTPLHEAVEQGRVDVIEFLLNNGASDVIKSNNGLTPRELAEIIGTHWPRTP